MKIVSIETSCDETAVAIVDFGAKKIKVLANLVSSQVAIHNNFGGVVPNLARREHEKNLIPIFKKALKEADLNLKKRKTTSAALAKVKVILSRESELYSRVRNHFFNTLAPDIDAIAVTSGPGLAPALWVGVNFARALSVLWSKPIIPVDHMKGHLYSSMVRREVGNTWVFNNKIKFPAVALLVSGGHTELIFLKGKKNFSVLGKTRDDAAGEAFDKVARLLKLPYPGGPEISKLAMKGDEKAIQFPRPMINSKDFDFSFSGLKTAVLYRLRDHPKSKKEDIAASFQKAVVDTLVYKTITAAKKKRAKSILLGGGVAANSSLRHNFEIEIKKNLPKTFFYPPPGELTGDNAFMISIAANRIGRAVKEQSVKVDANLDIKI